jgi:hypothetical protein
LNAKRILVEEEGGEEEKVEASMSPGDLSYAYHETWPLYQELIEVATRTSRPIPQGTNQEDSSARLCYTSGIPLTSWRGAHLR